ncbi:MAG: biotin-independent malonate decarboxylase subunit gamma [Lautropia sp.]|nr:biotin-independent malonate decarboxylase subunit gamma [Lautropia sp.]
MKETNPEGRARRWLSRLAGSSDVMEGFPASVLVVDGVLGDEPARYIAVEKDADNPFPRARNGEVGLLEGWSLARAVREVVSMDKGARIQRPIVAIIDTPSQAYGRREEAYGIHLSLASAVAAYAQARLEGHPVIGLIVGKAMSGAFLAHGYQANRLIALEDPEVMVHAMGKAAAARITLRTVEQLEALAQSVVPMAYDIGSFSRLGVLWQLARVSNAANPTTEDVAFIERSMLEALAEIRSDPRRDLSSRLMGGDSGRALSSRVRQRLGEMWEPGAMA